MQFLTILSADSSSMSPISARCGSSPLSNPQSAGRNPDLRWWKRSIHTFVAGSNIWICSRQIDKERTLPPTSQSSPSHPPVIPHHKAWECIKIEIGKSGHFRQIRQKTPFSATTAFIGKNCQNRHKHLPCQILLPNFAPWSQQVWTGVPQHLNLNF